MNKIKLNLKSSLVHDLMAIYKISINNAIHTRNGVTIRYEYRCRTTDRLICQNLKSHIHRFNRLKEIISSLCIQ